MGSISYSRGFSQSRDWTHVSCIFFIDSQILYHHATWEALISPRVCSNYWPLSRWCYLTISSSAAPFSCPQSFLATVSFPVSWPFTSEGQTIWASASASVLPMNSQGWFPLGLSGLTSLLSKQLSRVFFSTTVWSWLCADLFMFSIARLF